MENELIQRAIRAYFRRFGGGAPIPSHSNSYVEVVDGRENVVLVNVGGELARYFVDKNSNLRFIERDQDAA